MAGFTNKGKWILLKGYFQNVAEPTNLYVALVTSAVTPTADTNTLGQLTELSNANGYTTGGFQLARNGTDFDTADGEDDANDRGYIQIKDVFWDASGGSIGPARWAILTDDNGTVGSREVVAYFDLETDRTVTTGQRLTLQNLELRLNEA